MRFVTQAGPSCKYGFKPRLSPELVQELGPLGFWAVKHWLRASQGQACRRRILTVDEPQRNPIGLLSVLEGRGPVRRA